MICKQLSEVLESIQNGSTSQNCPHFDSRLNILDLTLYIVMLNKVHMLLLCRNRTQCLAKSVFMNEN